jgi:uncharacterized membrane protein
MPDLPLHAALVHLPLGLSFAVPFVAIGIALAVRRERLPRAAFAVLAGLQLLLAGSAVAAMLAGHRDERRVERIVDRRIVHEHEERGEAFAWTAVGVAAVAVGLLLVPARALALASAATVAGTLTVALLAYLAGAAGGEIVYRHGGAAAYAAPPAAVSHGDHDAADDDR